MNIGTENEIKISELMRLIARFTRFDGEVRWQTDKPDGQPRRHLDVSRAFETFGFRAQVPFEEGLKRTVEWYEKNRIAGRAPNEVNLRKQVEGFDQTMI